MDFLEEENTRTVRVENLDTFLSSIFKCLGTEK